MLKNFHRREQRTEPLGLLQKLMISSSILACGGVLNKDEAFERSVG
jgi:hypothetical protein